MSEPRLETFAQKTIVFRFCGGRHDGSIVRSDVEHTERFAKYFWKLTWNGTVGRRFDITDSKSTDYERYQVKVKDEHECEIVITCEVVS